MSYQPAELRIYNEAFSRLVEFHAKQNNTSAEDFIIEAVNSYIAQKQREANWLDNQSLSNTPKNKTKIDTNLEKDFLDEEKTISTLVL